MLRNNTEVNQVGNNVGRDNIGSQTIFNIFGWGKNSKLKRLVKKATQAIKEGVDKHKYKDSEICKLEEDLKPYIKPRDKISLENKLNAGGWNQATIDRAKELKGYFSREYAKYQLLPSALKLYKYSFCEIESKFQNLVYPLIIEGKSQSEIKQTINDRLIEEILSDLDIEDDVFNRRHVEGILYFLTAKCILKWS